MAGNNYFYTLCSVSSLLVAWIGDTDLIAAHEDNRTYPGPIARAVLERDFDEVLLLSTRSLQQKYTVGKAKNQTLVEVKVFVHWLKELKRHGPKISFRHAPLDSPTDHRQIFDAVQSALEGVAQNAPITFHLSPGTHAMAAVSLLIAKTLFVNATLIEASPEGGVREVNVPFDISAEFKRRSGNLQTVLNEGVTTNPAFVDVIHESESMRRVVRLAERTAQFEIPILIEGESGTGKELLARAIHGAARGPAAGAPFVAVNCAAVAEGLFESEFFGHRKGAFTGAVEDRVGYFEAAHGGTLFLDEVGELPLTQQAKLLRVLQEKLVTRVGETKARKFDARVIAASNRRLFQAVTENRFREDLFYRLAGATLVLPPLRSRGPDVPLLVDRLFAIANEQLKARTVTEHKKLSATAKNILVRYPWPGNVRQLLATLKRAIVWSESAVVTAEDIREALGEAPERSTKEDILHREMGASFSLDELMGEVAKHYLLRAMQQSNGTKVRAANLLGFDHYQTLSNWLDRYGVKWVGRNVAEKVDRRPEHPGVQNERAATKRESKRKW